MARCFLNVTKLPWPKPSWTSCEIGIERRVWRQQRAECRGHLTQRRWQQGEQGRAPRRQALGGGPASQLERGVAVFGDRAFRAQTGERPSKWMGLWASPSLFDVLGFVIIWVGLRVLCPALGLM